MRMKYATIGAKAARLCDLAAAGFAVPEFCVIESAVLDRFIESDRDLNQAFARYADGFINKLDILGRAQRVAELILSAPLPEHLSNEILATVEEAQVQRPWIARSSGSLEDADGIDLAGAYESIAGLHNSRGLIDGVRRCWASLYSPRALLRFSESSAAVDSTVRDLSRARMSVIVQTEIQAEWSGVAFSADPSTGNEGIIFVEASRVSGGVANGSSPAARAMACRRGPGEVSVEECDALMPRSLATGVAALAVSVREWAGSAQDIEWLSDDGGRLLLVQARPIGQRQRARTRRAEAVFELARVGEEPTGFRLGDCAGIAASYRKKKRGLRALAQSLAIPVPGWFWLHFNEAGLRRALRAGEFPWSGPRYVQLDVSTNIRAIVRPASALPGTLSNLARYHPDGRLTVQIRDSIRMDFGVVSAVLPDGVVRLEYVMGSLEGLRSGFCAASIVEVGLDGRISSCDRVMQGTADLFVPGQDRAVRGEFDRKPDYLPGAAVATIARWTRSLEASHPRIRPEWWIAAGHVVLADASYENGAFSDETMIVSEGTAEGVAVRVEPGDLPEDLASGYAISVDDVNESAYSIPAIRRFRDNRPWLPETGWMVLADRPRLELALLLPWASGFIFGQASLLGHLAITLRAVGKPAVVSAAPVRDGELIRINGADVSRVSGETSAPGQESSS